MNDDILPRDASGPHPAGVTLDPATAGTLHDAEPQDMETADYWTEVAESDSATLCYLHRRGYPTDNAQRSAAHYAPSAQDMRMSMIQTIASDPSVWRLCILHETEYARDGGGSGTCHAIMSAIMQHVVANLPHC
jgi:hypothetical protein